MRSSKKPFYVSFLLLKKIITTGIVASGKQLNTYIRRSGITPEMVGANLGVYNGKKFIPVFITENMVGHKLGEFSPTRKMPTRKGDDKKK